MTWILAYNILDENERKYFLSSVKSKCPFVIRITELSIHFNNENTNKEFVRNLVQIAKAARLSKYDSLELYYTKEFDEISVCRFKKRGCKNINRGELNFMSYFFMEEKYFQ